MDFNCSISHAVTTWQGLGEKTCSKRKSAQACGCAVRYPTTSFLMKTTDGWDGCMDLVARD